jgi:hypothetical protein
MITVISRSGSDDECVIALLTVFRRVRRVLCKTPTGLDQTCFQRGRVNAGPHVARETTQAAPAEESLRLRICECGLVRFLRRNLVAALHPC